MIKTIRDCIKSNKRNITRTVATSILSLSAVLGIGSPAAAIADPDYAEVRNAWVFVGCQEPGDMGILVDYSIDYDALPTETATEAYLFSLINDDGTTILKTATPYAYSTIGYGRGAVWFHLTPDEVTAANITAFDAITIRIDGNPAIVWDSGTIYSSIPKTITDWYSTPVDVDSRLATRVLSLASTYKTPWSVALIQETAAGTKLNSTGSQYFTTVIANLRTMAPDAFAAGEIEPESEVIEYGVNQSTTMMSNLIGTPLDMPNLALAVGLTYDEGVASFTNGGITVTGTNTAWSKSMIGRQFKATDGNFYFVRNVPSETELTLGSPYSGITLTNQPYDLVNTIMLTSGLWLTGMLFLLAGVVKVSNNRVKPALLLTVPIIVAGAVLGALDPKIAWGVGAACSILTVFIVLFKPSPT